MEDELIHGSAAAYALHALDEADESAFEAHLAGCARCREELAAFAGVTAALAFAAPPVEPPPALRGRILAAARAGRPGAVVRLRPRWAYPAVAVAAASTCAAVGLGVWAATLHSRLAGSGEALRSVALTGASGSLVVSRNGNAALVISGLPPTPAGKTYEAWVLLGQKAFPAGLFAERRGTTVLQLTRRVPGGAVVGVTLERAGGSATPSLPPLVTSART